MFRSFFPAAFTTSANPRRACDQHPAIVRFLPFLCNRMVYLVTIRHTDPAGSLFGIHGRVPFPGPLVFVKDDRVWPSSPERYTHIRLSDPAGRPSFAYLYHGFIRMHHMMLRKFCFSWSLYTAQVPLCSHDRPAAQGLCREKYIAAFKLFGKALDRLRVYMLQIINTGNQGRGSQTVPEQDPLDALRAQNFPIRTLHILST